jgi:hypothetical protein
MRHSLSFIFALFILILPKLATMKNSVVLAIAALAPAIKAQAGLYQQCQL